MGMLDDLLGNVIGGRMAAAVSGVIESHGGLAGFIAQLEQQGLGPIVASWVGKGANQPVTGAQLKQALGEQVLQRLSSTSGMKPGDLAEELAFVLPRAIDHLTPAGVVWPS